jgi:hypothetical protein
MVMREEPQIMGGNMCMRQNLKPEGGYSSCGLFKSIDRPLLEIPKFEGYPHRPPKKRIQVWDIDK